MFQWRISTPLVSALIGRKGPRKIQEKKIRDRCSLNINNKCYLICKALLLVNTGQGTRNMEENIDIDVCFVESFFRVVEISKTRSSDQHRIRPLLLPGTCDFYIGNRLPQFHIDICSKISVQVFIPSRKSPQTTVTLVICTSHNQFSSLPLITTQHLNVEFVSESSQRWIWGVWVLLQALKKRLNSSGTEVASY